MASLVGEGGMLDAKTMAVEVLHSGVSSEVLRRDMAWVGMPIHPSIWSRGPKIYMFSGDDV